MKDRTFWLLIVSTIVGALVIGKVTYNFVLILTKSVSASMEAGYTTGLFCSILFSLLVFILDAVVVIHSLKKTNNTRRRKLAPR